VTAEVSVINTATGPIDAGTLGVTLTHEHVVVTSPGLAHAFGDRWYDRQQVIEVGSALLRDAREQHGVTSIIDATPINLGRDVMLLEEVSRLSEVAIVPATGMYFTEEPSLRAWEPQQLGELFLTEVHEGISGTQIRPGVIKCATGPAGVTPLNETLVRAAGFAQAGSGLPVIAHADPKLRPGLQQLELMMGAGARPDRVVIGHCADTADLVYIESILREGAYVGLDRTGAFAHVNQLLPELLQRGWINQLLLSHDACTFLDFNATPWKKQCVDHRAPGATNPYTNVYRIVLPHLRAAGVAETDINTLLVDNPRRFLSGSN